MSYLAINSLDDLLGWYRPDPAGLDVGLAAALGGAQFVGVLPAGPLAVATLTGGERLRDRGAAPPTWCLDLVLGDPVTEQR
ncbi:hypothetical protein [Micromonospora schwarzwaldensis]|uniref:hypothetical protein n=1 Tax=Micromonospora sp. DSM 45708 TaxID=3111767 RepID=UPI0031D0ABAA